MTDDTAAEKELGLVLERLHRERRRILRAIRLGEATEDQQRTLEGLRPTIDQLSVRLEALRPKVEFPEAAIRTIIAALQTD